MAARAGAGGTDLVSNWAQATVQRWSSSSTLPGTANLVAGSVQRWRIIATLPAESPGPTALWAGTTNDAFNFTNWTMRSITKSVSNLFSAYRGQIRVTIASTENNGHAASHVSVGIWDGVANKTGTKATPVEVTFSGGHGYSISANSSVTSDWISIAALSTDSFVVITDSTGAAGCVASGVSEGLGADFSAGTSWNSAADPDNSLFDATIFQGFSKLETIVALASTTWLSVNNPSTLPGSAALVASASQIWVTNPATLPASSDLSLNATHTPTASAALAGSAAIAYTFVQQFTAGQLVESGTGSSITLAKRAWSEIEFGLAVVPDDLFTGDTLAFRVYVDGSPITYDVTPSFAAQISRLATAVFAGSSSLAANATHTPQGAATLAGAASLVANFTHTPLGASTFPGVANLALDATHTPSLTATLAGSAAIAYTFVQQFTAGELVEDGTASAVTLAKRAWTEIEFGLAVVAADVANGDTLAFRVYVDGSPITYDVTPTFNALVPYFATVVLAGQSSLVAGTVQRWSSSATLPASSDISASAVQKWTISAVMAGSSSLTVSVFDEEVDAATLSAVSSLAASTVQIMAVLATLPSTSSLVANFTHTPQAAATFEGTSNLVAAASQRWTVAATLPAQSDLSASAMKLIFASATMAGSSSLQASFAAAGTIDASAELDGASALTATAQIVSLIRATLSSTSSMFASAQIHKFATVVFAGSSSLSVTTVEEELSTELLSGQSNLAASMVQVMRVLSTLPGSSALSATAATVQPMRATLAGTSTLSVQARVIYTGHRIKSLNVADASNSPNASQSGSKAGVSTRGSTLSVTATVVRSPNTTIKSNTPGTEVS